MSLPHEEVREEDLKDLTFVDSTDVNNQQAQLQPFLQGQFHSCGNISTSLHSENIIKQVVSTVSRSTQVIQS